MKKENRQAELLQLCEDASGGGVAWVAQLNRDGTVSLRRDEEFAPSHTSRVSWQQACAILRSHAEYAMATEDD
jgi:hypothetical protein